MEIFKGEEGEIMLFNKRQNGILIPKIIEKNFDNINNIKIPEVNEFPNYDELFNNYSNFNIFSQKLSFNSSLSGKNCDFGCYLLITYYSNISESLNINGTEFSILSRIWDKEEFKSQIINIPLNEYTFGIFDETTINNHYYSVFIPFDTDNIYIEINGKNILGYSQAGIVQIGEANMTRDKQIFIKFQNKMVITLKKNDIGLQSLKAEYISFVFKKDIKNISSYYYFRIVQQNPESSYIIYSLDTNKENLCQIYNSKCYFLLKNEYNVLSNKIHIYGYGKNQISYKVHYMNDIDYYSTNFNLENLPCFFYKSNCIYKSNCNIFFII